MTGTFEQNKTNLTEAIEALDIHTHLCLIYENRAEQFAAIVPFFRMGLERGEQCLYIADNNTDTQVLAGLREGGIEIEAGLNSGAIEVIPTEEAYLKPGYFDPDWMIQFLKEKTAAALAAGFSALRITAEMSWAMESEPGVERLMEYEAKLNYFFPEHKALAICQYNRHRFTSESLIDVIHTHPQIIVGGLVCHNFYYVPPAEFLEPPQVQKKVERLLNNIVACKRDKMMLTEGKQALEEVNHQLQIEIADRRQAETALQSSEQKFRRLVEQSYDGIIIADQTGAIIEWNQSMERITGLTRSDVIGEALWDIHTELVVKDKQPVAEARQWITATILDYLKTKDAAWLNQIIEREIERPDRSRRNLQFVNFSIETNQGSLLVTFCRDITEQKVTQEWLRKLSSVVEQTADLVIVTDKAGLIQYVNPAFEALTGYSITETLGQKPNILKSNQHTPSFYERLWHTILTGQVFQDIFINSTKNGDYYYEEKTITPLRDKRGHITHFISTGKDITERKLNETALWQAVETMQQRNRELILVNRANQAFNSTLDLDQVLSTVLDEIRRLLDVVATSVWLVDQASQTLVCRQATGPQRHMVQGWELPRGEGLVGWTAEQCRSLIVPDIWLDERHYKGLDQQTGLDLRSILSVPMVGRDQVVGVLQVVDNTQDRFNAADLSLLESLAAAAAMAIENAELYEQAQLNAETKTLLLNEVNHRVKNNLSAIMGLLYIEKQRSRIDTATEYRRLMKDLISRIQSLSVAHNLLAEAEWQPILLSDLIGKLLHVSSQSLGRGRQLVIDVLPSPIVVTSREANSLALIVNELNSNVLKHVLPHQPSTRMTARFHTEDDMKVLTFVDNGPGYPEQVLQFEGFHVGLYLVHTLVRNDLRGSLTLKNDDGAVAVIRFKTLNS